MAYGGEDDVSIKVMTDVWADADCKGSELLVLLALADFSDDEGENIYPSMQTLARKTRLSDKQVRRVIQTLVKLELLEILEPGGWKYGRNRANSYRIRLENIGTPKMSVPLGHAGEYRTGIGGSTVLPPAGDDPSSKSLYNPPLKGRRPTPGRKNGGKRRSYNPDDYDDL